jgi:hypothetical protein
MIAGPMTPERFVERLAELGRPIVEGGALTEYNDFLQRSFPTWVAIRPRGLAVTATDPILALYEGYEVVGVTIANYKLQPLSRDEGLIHFACEGPTDYFVREDGEVFGFYHKECYPAPLGQSSASFLECLLVEAEFVSRCSLRRVADLAARAELYREYRARMRERTSLERWLDPFDRGLASLAGP